ncbi:DUF3995 domain-containing protein [Devosia nitrariae]|uniref:DUF3995 domain-containing protein n=1 Tax=Devosia nitrariae TaxID=2071872 RepID=A0ABQ5W0Y7_9HYPH|nr:DUF3995 domain-containing protein [Devosia nitrariae]GLQ53539.1 hypothetical protein GCM10010862_07980 [Devosia nitrariae]
MSMLVASLMFVALLAVSFAHFLWATGRTWPIRNEKLLAQTVVGLKDIEHMPPRIASLAVSIAMLAAGILALALADEAAGGLWLTLAGIVPASLFLTRGVLGYTRWWAERTPEPNFRLNDARVYSPLCIALGIGFIALIAPRLI